MMKLSVIVPTYNVSRFLPETLRSLMAQSVQEAEFICVDDCSTDDTWKLLEEAAAKDPRFRLLRQERNQGVAHARKRAVAESTGDYVMFLDGDDALEDDACAFLLEEIGRRDVDMLHFGMTVLGQDNVPESECEWVSCFVRPGTEEIRRDDLYNACFVEKLFGFTLCNKIYRGEVARSAFACYPEDKRMDVAEDLLASFMIQFFSHSYGAVEKKCYIYHFGAGITGGKKITVEQMRQYAQQGDVVKAIDIFLAGQQATERCRAARDIIYAQMVETAAWNWLKTVDQQDAAEAFDVISSSFSSSDLIGCMWKNMDAWQIDAKQIELISCIWKNKDVWDIDAAQIINRLYGGRGFAAQPREIRTVAAFYYRAYNGGLERVATRLLESWVDAGYRVVLITDEDENELDYPYPPEVARVCMGDGARQGEARVRKLSQIIQEYQIDAVIYHAWCSPMLIQDMMAIKLSHALMLIHMHGRSSYMYLSSHPDELLVAAQMGPVFALCDGVITISDVDTAWAKMWTPRVYKTCNPIDMPFDDRMPVGQHSHEILWIGRISAEKQPVMALEILRQVLDSVPDARLHFVGQADAEEYNAIFEKAIDDLGVRDAVVLHGYQKDVKPFYRQCALSINTSMFEGSPLAILESKTLARPVVAFDIVNVDMIREAKGMFVVRQNDVPAAAAAVVRLLEDEGLWERMCRESLESARPVCTFDQKARWASIFADLNVERVPEQMDDLRTVATIMRTGDLINGLAQIDREVAFYRDNAAGFEKSYQFYKAQAEGFEKDARYYRSQAESFEKESAYYREQAQYYQPRAESFEKEVAYFKEQAEGFEKKAQYFQTQAESFEKESAYFRKQAEDFEKEMKYYQPRAENFEKESIYYKGQAEGFEKELKYYQPRAESFEKESIYYRGQAEGFEKELKYYQPRAESFEKESAYYRKQAEDFEKELKYYQPRAENFEKESAYYRRQAEGFEKEFRYYQARAEEFEQESQRYQTRAEEFEQESQRYQARAAAFEAESAQNKQESERYQSLSENLQQQLEATVEFKVKALVRRIRARLKTRKTR